VPSPEGVEILASTADGEGRRLVLRIPEGTALCEGHFPGHPIVPGIAHLAWVERALGDLLGRPARLRSIRAFRLRRPIHPCDELELTVQSAGPGAGTWHRNPDEISAQESSSPAPNSLYLFSLRRGTETVSDGRVEEGGWEEIPVGEGWVNEGGEKDVWLSEGWESGGRTREGWMEGRREPEGAAAALPPVSAGSRAFPAVESLIPHRGPMRLLHRVLSVAAEVLLGEAAVPADNPLARERVPAWLALEAAAQAAAALEALSRERETGPRLGYLVGVREARLQAADLAAEASFRILVRAQGSAPPLAIYEARAERDGAAFLSATLSTYLPD
jgi:predicted hotdog family 3-hydroxylacyl-ACP dehydratase